MRRAFTLLEVIIALGILSVSLMILVESQAGAVMMGTESKRLDAATMLANEKMLETLLVLEREGWSTQDKEDEGNFEDFGAEEFRGDDLHLDDMAKEFDEFRWATTIRKIELALPGDVAGMTDELAGSGYWGDDAASDFDGGGMPDLGDMGVSSEMITDYLGNFIREVRVIVWWDGENMPEKGDGDRSIELVHHAINPTGMVLSEDVEP